MAVGDVVASAVNLAAGASSTFQPAAGVEVKITLSGGVGTATYFMTSLGVSARITGNEHSITSQGIGNALYTNFAGNERPTNTTGTLFINNSTFLYFQTVPATSYGYCGIQTK